MPKTDALTPAQRRDLVEWLVTGWEGGENATSK